MSVTHQKVVNLAFFHISSIGNNTNGVTTEIEFSIRCNSEIDILQIY